MIRAPRGASSILILGAVERPYGERNENIRGVFPERNLTLGFKDCHAASTPVIKHKPEAESDEHCARGPIERLRYAWPAQPP